jgi:pimeloyl-ACP methyl ester carboxylesterase
MRSLPPVPLLLGLLIGLTPTGLPAARGADVKNDKAADDKSDKVKFDTVDHVELHGVWYGPTTGIGKKAPAVILLHNVKSDISKDGWDKLARELQDAGYAVLAFDFRGHGNSTAVDPSFWNDTTSVGLAALTKFNREQVHNFNPNNPKQSISIKDFNTSYYPALVNDIEAARAFVDRKNDSNECNSSNLILIGAEEGAALGALWMASEMSLYRVTSVNMFSGLPQRWATTPEGKDIGAAVWLSVSPAIGSYNAPVSSWLQMGVKEKKVPMAFVYGDKDTTAASYSKRCLAAVKPKDSKAKLTGENPIKDSKLSGNALLGDQLSARKWIIDTYLKAVKDEQVAPAWEEKKDDESPFAWVLPGGNQPILAKSEKEKVMNPIPWTRFMNR